MSETRTPRLDWKRRSNGVWFARVGPFFLETYKTSYCIWTVYLVRKPTDYRYLNKGVVDGTLLAAQLAAEDWLFSTCEEVLRAREGKA